MKLDGKTVCISTHNLKDVEVMCTDFTVFDKGVCSGAQSMSELFAKSNNWSVSVENVDEAEKIIGKSSEFNLIDKFNNRFMIKSNDRNKLEDINVLLKSCSIISINKESNLIDYFKND